VGTGQTGILAKYPDIVSEITTQLGGLQTSGVVNVFVACSIMLAVIKERKLELLVNFKCSKVTSLYYFDFVINILLSVICPIILGK
jgi:hypothetical protein